MSKNAVCLNRRAEMKFSTTLDNLDRDDLNGALLQDWVTLCS